MSLLSILAFALSSSFDNMGVGVAYGMRGVCIPFPSNLMIALMNGAGTLVSMLAGASVTRFLEPRASGIIGGSIVMCIGLWVVIDRTRHRRRWDSLEEELTVRSRGLEGMTFPGRVWAIFRNPFITGPQCSGSMRMGESVLLGSALTMTNLVTGLAAGIMGINVAGLTFASFIFNLAAIHLGTNAGSSRMFRWMGHSSGVISGILLIGIGLAEMIF